MNNCSCTRLNRALIEKTLNLLLIADFVFNSTSVKLTMCNEVSHPDKQE